MTNFHIRKILILSFCTLLAVGVLFGLGWHTLSDWPVLAAQSGAPSAGEIHPQAQPNAALDASVILTMTVGIVENLCAETSAATIVANKLVFLCYRIGNPGTVPLTSYNLTHSPPGLTDGGGLALAPGAETTRILGAVFTNTTTLTATLLASATISDTTVNVSSSDSVSISVLRPSASIGYNLSVSPDQCGTPVLSFASGATIYHCIVIRNTGPLALTQQTLSIPALGISSVPLSLNLSSGQAITLTENNRPNLTIPLVQQGVLASFSSPASLVVQTAEGDSITVTATASGNAGSVRTTTTVNAGSDPNTCAAAHTPVMLGGAIVYFCVRITNSGTTTITEHSLLVPELSIDVSFQAPLPPNQTLTLNSRPLSNTITVAALGPYTLTQSLSLVFVYKPGKDQEAGTSESIPLNVAIATPTPTRTITPTATTTPVPLPSDTPIFTPSPTDTPLATIPPTPSETPTFTPSPITPPPSPTRSFAISALATPTPIIPTPDFVATNNALVAEQATAAFVQAVAAQAAQATSFAIQTEQIIAATNAAVALLTPLPPPAAFVDPNATPTLDPLNPGAVPVPGEVPTPIVATEVLPAVTQPEQAAAESALLTAPVVITITATPDPALRPIAPAAPPPPATDLLSIFGQSVERVLVVASWVWFLLAGLIFLLVTAIFFGLTLRRGPEERFDLFELASEEIDEREQRPNPRAPTTSSSRRRSTSNDPWPDSLP